MLLLAAGCGARAARMSVTPAGTTPRMFSLEPAAGGRSAHADFHRSLLAAPLERVALSVSSTGLYGDFLARRGDRHRPAVLLLGGSEGGLADYVLQIAEHLAAHGYPVLAVGYFAAPALPRTLTDVPLEYFARGLRWLAARPEADARRIDVFGISRGSEAAQLVAIDWPGLVRDVVLGVPSDTVGFCFGGLCKGAAWTVHGRAIAPGGDLPVARIHGRVFALCGEEDTVWPSCPIARTIEARRRAAGLGRGDVLVAGADASHFVSAFVPYRIFADDRTYVGRDADAAADEIAWPKLLAFLGPPG